MDFALSVAQLDAQERLRSFLATRVPEPVLRQQMATDRGFDPQVWSALCATGGVAGLGAGSAAAPSLVDVAAAMEVMGELLYGGPYLSTVVLAGQVLAATAPDDAARRLLEPSQTGEAVLALAYAETDDVLLPPVPSVTVRRAGDGWALDGEKRYVVDGHTADTLVVLAHDGADPVLVEVAGDAPGMTRTLLPTLDMTRKQAAVSFAGTPARPLALTAPVTELWPRLFARTQVAVAAEQLGGARRCLALAVDYARGREQFGRPIGSFQAVKHMCADLLADIESACSAVYYAAWAADVGSDELPAMAALAKTVCSETYLRAAGRCIQIHGGVGFTWDNPANLYFKRAKSTQLLFGDPMRNRELIAALTGL